MMMLLAFLVAITILVAVHEFGHYWVARRVGVKVLRFSIGFGKPLWKRTTKSGMEFVVAMIPLGGYVKMLDEREGDVAADELMHAFNRKSLAARTAVILAGPVFNFLFAILAYWFIFMLGITGVNPIIGTVKPNSVAASVGLQKGQQIMSVGGQSTLDWSQVQRRMLEYIGEKNMPISVKDKSGRVQQYDLNINNLAIDKTAPQPLKSLGISSYHPEIAPIIASVVQGLPADKAGLKAGDKVLTVMAKPIANWTEFVDSIKPRANQLTQLTVLRGGKTVAIKVTPELKKSADGDHYGFLGVESQKVEWPKSMLHKQQYGPMTALGKSIIKTYDTSALSLAMLWKMVTGHISVRSLSGPISIAKWAGVTAQIGLIAYLNFLALISISIGIINLLPIPVLDGGHLLFNLCEFILKRPLSIQTQVLAYKIGLILLMILMTIVFYNDFTRF